MILKDNNLLYKEVQDALHWYRELNGADLNILVKEGVITLAGVVENYWQKEEALRAVKNVIGVKAVEENIKVKINTWTDPSDDMIEKQISNIFKWQCDIPEEILKFRVENGWVTLSGEVQWQFQKKAAYKAITKLRGVKGINDLITLPIQSGTKIDKKSLESALIRSASTGRETIKVEIAGNRVILTGSVSSFYQKEEAGKIAWSVPGVEQVDNQLVIEIKSDRE